MLDFEAVLGHKCGGAGWLGGTVCREGRLSLDLMLPDLGEGYPLMEGDYEKVQGGMPFACDGGLSLAQVDGGHAEDLGNRGRLLFSMQRCTNLPCAVESRPLERAEREEKQASDVAKYIAKLMAKVYSTGIEIGSGVPLGRNQCTTLIIKNIPLRSTKTSLKELWPPEGSWNLLYLPWSPTQRRVVGYVFVNFVSDEAAADFYEKWHGHLFLPGKLRSLDIRPADLQGYWENLWHMRLTRVGGITNDKYTPIIIGHDGVERNFREVMDSMQMLKMGL